MSDDRLAQSRAEAWRRYPEGWDPYNEEPVDDWGYSECQREAFRAGVEWADANPHPHTITRAALRDTAMMIAHTRQDEIEAMLPGLLGIEVVDDE